MRQVAFVFPPSSSMRARRLQELLEVLTVVDGELREIVAGIHRGLNPLQTASEVNDDLVHLASCTVYIRRLRAARSRLLNFHSYGKCLKCDNEIELGDLRGLPFKKYCRKCDHELYAERRQLLLAGATELGQLFSLPYRQGEFKKRYKTH